MTSILIGLFWGIFTGITFICLHLHFKFPILLALFVAFAAGITFDVATALAFIKFGWL